MSEELVNRLKNCVFNTEGNCSECPYQNSYTYCMEDLIMKAADDICETAKKLHEAAEILSNGEAKDV